MSSQSLRKRAQEFRRHRADAALALDRLDHQRRGLAVTARSAPPDRVQVVGSGTWSKPASLGAEAFEIFLIPARGDARQRAAMKGAFEADDVEAFGMAVHILVAARHLEGEFARLGAGIGEEHRVGEGVRHQLGARLSCPGTR